MEGINYMSLILITRRGNLFYKIIPGLGGRGT